MENVPKLLLIIIGKDKKDEQINMWCVLQFVNRLSSQPAEIAGRVTIYLITQKIFLLEI